MISNHDIRLKHVARCNANSTGLERIGSCRLVIAARPSPTFKSRLINTYQRPHWQCEHIVHVKYTHSLLTPIYKSPAINAPATLPLSPVVFLFLRRATLLS